MITIKLPYETSEENILKINNLRKQYSSVLRYSYNRFTEGFKQKEVRGLTKKLKNVHNLNSWFIQNAVIEAQGIKKRFKNETVIFGGKKNFNLRLQGKISKEEFQKKRLSSLSVQGEELKQGNRSFKLDVIENNSIIFKVSRTEHLELKLPKLRNNYKKQLFNLEQLNEIKNNQKGKTYSVRLTDKFIYITFDQEKSVSNLIETRHLGIDLNPNHIGISIKDENKVIFTKQYDLSQITKALTSERNSSNSRRFKYLNNKLNHETIEIVKDISKLLQHYKVRFVFIEDLDKINVGNAGLGKNFNRLTRNLWKRTNFVSNLEKRVKLNGSKLFKVNAAYSSFIGNVQHSYSDPVNASLEIARRGYEVIIKKNKKFYPDLTVETVKNQWKKHLTDEVKSWKEFFNEAKNSKLKYRVSLDEVSFKVFRLNSYKSKVINYEFT
jgi:predicted transposase